jgi:nicotinamidase-related amidase
MAATTYPTDISALVLVDVLNDLLSPEGKINTRELRIKSIQKLVFAGLTSHTCVEGTGRQATELGYHLTFIRDGVVEFTDEAHLAAIGISYPTFGHEVLTVEEFLAAVVQVR